MLCGVVTEGSKPHKIIAKGIFVFTMRMLHEYFLCVSLHAMVYYPFKLSRKQLSFQQMKQMYAYCDT
jgi:hypothetical protein